MKKPSAKKPNKKTNPVQVEGSRKKGWFLFIVGVSSIFLLAVVFLAPRNSAKFTPPQLADGPAKRGTADSDLLTSSQADAPKIEREKAHVSLPKTPAEFNSELEKKRLLEDVEDAVKQFPSDATVLHIAALTYSELLQTERAVELFQRSLAANPNDAEVLVAYAKMALPLDRDEEVINLLQAAVDQGVDAESILTSLGEAYNQNGQPEKAEKLLEKAVGAAASGSRANLLLAQTFIQLNKFEDAERCARAALKDNQNDRAIYVALSTAMLRQGKRDEALAIRNQMQTIAPLAPTDVNKYENSFRGFVSHTYSMLGSAYISHDVKATAEKFLLRSLEVNPAYLKSVLQLGDLFRREGRVQDALVVHERLIEIQPDNFLNYRNLASLAVALGDVKLAEDALRKGAAADVSGNGDLVLSQLLLGIGKIDEGIKHAQIAVDRLNSVEAYLILIAALKSRGDSTQAFNVFCKVKKLAPNDPRLAEFKP